MASIPIITVWNSRRLSVMVSCTCARLRAHVIQTPNAITQHRDHEHTLYTENATWPAGPLVSDGLIMWKFSRLTRIEGFPRGPCMGPRSANVEYRVKLSDVTFFFRLRGMPHAMKRGHVIRSWYFDVELAPQSFWFRSRSRLTSCDVTTTSHYFYASYYYIFTAATQTYWNNSPFGNSRLHTSAHYFTQYRIIVIIIINDPHRIRIMIID